MAREWARRELTPVTGAGPKVWPFYVVYDVSWSMRNPEVHGDYTPWHVMRDSLADLIAEIDYSPEARDICHLAVLAFSDDVDVVMPLTSLRSNEVNIPNLPEGGQTNYQRVFKTLASMVGSDYARLKDTARVKSPAVYFVTDGYPQVNNKRQPNDAWMPELAKLHKLDAKPVVVALGLGTADESSLQVIRAKPGPACTATSNASPGDLLKAIVKSIIMSVVNSAGRDEFTFEVPPGMRRLA